MGQFSKIVFSSPEIGAKADRVPASVLKVTTLQMVAN